MISEAIDRKPGFPWAWTEHQRGSQLAIADEEMRVERRPALGHGHVWAGYGGDGEVGDQVVHQSLDLKRNLGWEAERAAARQRRDDGQW